MQKSIETLKIWTPTGELLAVDPGKKHAGVAFFRDGILVAADLIRADDPLSVAFAVLNWVGAVPAKTGVARYDYVPDPNEVDVIVTERQQIYPGIRKADPNDLLPLAECVGAVNALIQAPMRKRPLPREWKGSTPKAIFTQRIEEGMSAEEHAIVAAKKLPKSLVHNVIDAIGLGKWGLTGRAW
jgi:hypothetical protein